MTDNENGRKKPERDNSNSENRGGGNVWLVLAGVTCAVLVCAYLFGSDKQQLRYPDLMHLLNAQADAKEAIEANEGSKVAVAAIEVKSTRNPENVWEFSNPNFIDVADDMLTGKVMFRSLGKDGVDRDKAGNIPKEVDFLTRRVPNDEQDKNLNATLQRSGVIWDNAHPNRFLANHWPELLMIGVLILLGVIMLRRIGGVGSPMSFSRSRGKLHGQEDLSIMFDDAAGIDEAVDEVREVVDFLKNSEKYQALGGRIPKGVLLVGPPGTGKTLLAKAIAGEAGVPFFSLVRQ